LQVLELLIRGDKQTISLLYTDPTAQGGKDTMIDVTVDGKSQHACTSTPSEPSLYTS
jgi:hypothetical protein